MQVARYQRVCWESFGYTLPGEVLSSDQLETQLEPLYERLRLPAGRLELMTGIRERRFWSPGTLPSEPSIASAERALTAAGVDRQEIGVLVHASVCRDYLEPATASVVHRGLGLPEACLIYDLSNACLGFLDGVLQVANMIELGQVRAGLVVASEGGRELVENTVERLNADHGLSRDDVKLAVASLTIGSASVAAVLVDARQSATGNQLLHAVAGAATEHVALCQSGRDDAAGHDMRPLMRTDSERLLLAGVEAATRTFDRFLEAGRWDRSDIDRTFCHQVGVAHRKLMMAALDLDAERDFTTVEWLGNTGSAALPITMALAGEQGQIDSDARLALMGIGSGINVLMLGARWQESRVLGGVEELGTGFCAHGLPSAQKNSTVQANAAAPRLSAAL